MRRALAVAFIGIAACSAKPRPTTSSASASVSASPPSDATPQPSSSADSAPAWLGIHKSSDEVAKVINPEGNPIYNGKTGTVHGTVTITGDPPPDVPFTSERACATAKGYYDKLFRKSEQGGVADAVVAVTGYKGFVPAEAPSKTVLINDCSFGARAIVLTFGQRLEVLNRDTKVSFMPYLDGAPFAAALVATPQGNPVKLYPEHQGLYLLRDMLKHPFLLAHVFVLAYRTADVTGADGHFEIRGVPLGKARINAFLPMLDKKATEKDIEVREGDNEVEIELTYDKASDKPVQIPDAVWQQKH